PPNHRRSDGDVCCDLEARDQGRARSETHLAVSAPGGRQGSRQKSVARRARHEATSRGRAMSTDTCERRLARSSIMVIETRSETEIGLCRVDRDPGAIAAAARRRVLSRKTRMPRYERVSVFDHELGRDVEGGDLTAMLPRRPRQPPRARVRERHPEL